MATGIAGGMMAEGARQLALGKRPRVSDLLLTPANARRLAEQLAKLRGAAMKVGQLISMESGDLLPPALAEILGRLREDARAMFDRIHGALSPLGLLSEDFEPAPPRMWGNFPQTYSHVGLIHAAFAASPSWTEVL